ncbi:MAG: two-CW domain-containing protein [Endomicrobiales bacterium]
MAEQKNCWEFKQCGREQGGAKVAELGVCPAAIDVSATGVNGGKNGGRICWAVSGTFCGGKVQGTFAQKESSCLCCDFFNKVKAEEKGDFSLLRSGQTFKRRTGA